VQERVGQRVKESSREKTPLRSRCCTVMETFRFAPRSADPLLEILGDARELGQADAEPDGNPLHRPPAGIPFAFLQPRDLARVEPDALRQRALCKPGFGPDFPDSPGDPPLWFLPTGHPGQQTRSSLCFL